MSGLQDPAAAAARLVGRLAAGGLVVVRTGARGCWLAAAGVEPLHVPGRPAHVVDTTGAGDAHVAAFLARLSLGDDPARAAWVANVAASLTVERPGPATGPTPTLPGGCDTSAMELTQVMRTAGSTRRFTSDPVPDDVVYRVLDNARFAPSGNNRQGWRVIVVRDSAVRVQLRDLSRKSWYTYHAPLFTPPGQPPTPDHYADHLDEVPVHLVVLVKQAALTTTIQALDASHHIGGASVYPFVQNLVLGLRAAGLGTTLSTVLVPVEAEVKQLLRIPDGVALAAHLGVGWPAGPLPTRLTRRPVADFTTVDSFDGEAFQPGPDLRLER